jgi:hypothetical protein
MFHCFSTALSLCLTDYLGTWHFFFLQTAHLHIIIIIIIIIVLPEVNWHVGSVAVW